MKTNELTISDAKTVKNVHWCKGHKLGSFENAMSECKAGIPVTRAGWIGIWGDAYLKAMDPKPEARINTPFMLLTAPYGQTTVWTPTQEDLFARDWYTLVFEGV